MQFKNEQLSSVSDDGIMQFLNIDRCEMCNRTSTSNVVLINCCSTNCTMAQLVCHFVHIRTENATIMTGQ